MKKSHCEWHLPAKHVLAKPAARREYAAGEGATFIRRAGPLRTGRGLKNKGAGS
jgi:hypothetical protein